MSRKKPAAPEASFIGCTVKQLPKKDWLAAALAAIDENPANAPPPASTLTVTLTQDTKAGTYTLTPRA